LSFSAEKKTYVYPMPTKNPPATTDQSVNPTGKAWSGRFSEPVTELVKRFTASVTFDKRLAYADIQGSLAHAAMLARVGVITPADLADISRGMAIITQEIDEGTFDWDSIPVDHATIRSQPISGFGCVMRLTG